MQGTIYFYIRSVCLFVGIFFIGAGYVFASGDVYPNRPIRLIVPFSPGGGTDQISRALAAGMTKELGQAVVIENKPGAGTVIGMDAVAKGVPDGYTLVMATFAHAVNPSLQAKLPYDNDRSFAPVALIARGPNLLVVRSESPFKSVVEVIAAARAKPGVLTYASQGNGTSAHLAGEMFVNLAKVDLTHVPYRGASPAMTDLLGGQVDLFFGTAAAVSPLLASGKLRALAVTSAEPSAAFSGVPTVNQTIPGYAVESWYGLYAPAGTPERVISILGASIARAVKSPDFIKKVEYEGLTIVAGPPSDFQSYVQGEQALWKKIITENKIQLQ
jgi:tripartite-type tricarboxylate transporter receptor subunit TctC